MRDLGDINPDIRGRSRPVDSRIAWLAERQYGRVARRQLLAMGISSSSIDHRVASGRMSVVLPGVYAFGTPIETREALWSAGVLAGGHAALLSHRDACLLHEILRGSIQTIDVTTADRNRRGCRGIRLHRVRSLHPADRARVAGIPVTSLARTLLDLAGTRPALLPRAIEAADDRGLLHLPDVEALLGRSRGRRGGRALRDALALYEPTPRLTRSEAERALVRLCKEHGIPPPAMNLNVVGHEVDALWEEAKVIVEIDTYGTHSSRASFERDRRRDADLQLAGYRVVRVTDVRLADEPAAVAALLRSLVGR